jgi:hypothetical protein
MDSSAAEVEERVWDKEQLIIAFSKQVGRLNFNINYLVYHILYICTRMMHVLVLN